MSSLQKRATRLTFRGGLGKGAISCYCSSRAATDSGESFMTYDVISDFAFGASFGFVKSGTDVGGLIKGFYDGIVSFGILGRLYPFTNWIKATWIGDKYLVARPEQVSGIGALMRFRDKLVDQRTADVQEGKLGDRIDLLQTWVP